MLKDVEVVAYETTDTQLTCGMVYRVIEVRMIGEDLFLVVDVDRRPMFYKATRFRPHGF